MDDQWILLTLTLFLIALTPRVYDLDGHSLTADELNWMERGTDFVDKVISFKIANSTDLFVGESGYGHPGVPSAALIGISMSLFAGPLGCISAARLPIAFVGALSCIFLFLLVASVCGTRVGFLAGLFLALSPFHVGLSRIAHIDSSLMLFMMASILTYYVSVREKNFKLKIVSAVFFGFAILTKAPAFILIPILFIWRVLVWVKDRFGLKSEVKSNLPFELTDVVWFIVGITMFLVLYPRMWSNTFSYFWGHLTKEGVSFIGNIEEEHYSRFFYLLISLIRSTELLLVFIAIGVLTTLNRLVRKKFIEDFIMLLIVWFFVFIGVISTSRIMGDRYMLPVWPVLCIFGAIGLDQSMVFLGGKLKFIGNHVFTASVCCILMFLLPWIFLYSPNYYLYYNLFVGGPEGAKNHVLVGWGEGHKEAMEYIKNVVGAGKKISILGYDSIARKYYWGMVTDAREDDWNSSNYLIINNNMLARYMNLSAVRYMRENKPWHTVTLNGVDIAWIYKLSDSELVETDTVVPLFVQRMNNHWETFVDFAAPNRDMTLNQIIFNVTSVEGNGVGLKFNIYIGLDDGPWGISNPVLVKKEYKPQWRAGEQSLILDTPYPLKGGGIYTLHITDAMTPITYCAHRIYETPLDLIENIVGMNMWFMEGDEEFIPVESMKSNESKIFPIPILRQAHTEKWEIYLDFVAGEDKYINSIQSNVSTVLGTGEDLNFDWILGVENGNCSIKYPVVVKKNFVPEWRSGMQKIVLDQPYPVKENGRYTLLIRTDENTHETFDEMLRINARESELNRINISAVSIPELTTYGVKRDNPLWTYSESKMAKLKYG